MLSMTSSVGSVLLQQCVTFKNTSHETRTTLVMSASQWRLLVTLLKRKREAKCKSFGKSGCRSKSQRVLSFCGKKSQMAKRVQNHWWSLLTKWSWVQSHWFRNDSKEDCVCFYGSSQMSKKFFTMESFISFCFLQVFRRFY